ncbi:hypothetical protein CU098_006579 [Rhizopus stolonifer]|uniref:Uncharacterized protein n=1 Tax=Rhizopus stolonifer TaxID=4846 RepID=A0A367ILU5_RHIST|nr:hypothetical protein CU098_006579 [Rhizopus stolonifer]
MSNSTLEQNEVLSKQLQSLFKSQNTRNELYQEFDIAFKDYLSGNCPAEQYHSICRIVTEGFQEVSVEIQTMEKNMTNALLARTVRDLQEAERKKLQEIQILTVQSKESDKDYDETIREHQERLKEVLETIQDIMDELREEMAGLASLVC